MDDVGIRSMSAGDIAGVQEVSHAALLEAGRAYGWEMSELDDAARQRGRRRLAHLLDHDPAGAFVADRAGEVVGVGLATRRGPLWFLSLLAVATGAQSQGIGRRLLEATMTTLGEAGALCASSDPRALRRYWRAGFALAPAFEAKGELDRRTIPAIAGVREGSFDSDREFVEHVATLQRGAPHGVDIDYYAGADRRLLVTDTVAGQGYVVCDDAGPAVLAASGADAATRLLWSALAEATKPADVLWLSHDQRWAIDVVLEARLSLSLVGCRCLKSPGGPMSPYLPNGSLG